MFKVRVIPCLDVKDGRVVKGVNFVDLRDAGDPVEAAIAYDAAGADELCFLDITASHENRGTILDVVTRTAEACFMPLTVGGGVRTVEDIRKLLRRGADKVSINTAAVNAPRLREGGGGEIRRPVHRRGDRRQESVEARRAGPLGDLHPWRPQADRASMRSTMRARWWRSAPAKSCSPRWTATARKPGFDIALTRAIADAVPVPVIASGGVGNLDHLVEGIRDGHATAVLAASIFHFGEYHGAAGQGAHGARRPADAARSVGARHAPRLAQASACSSRSLPQNSSPSRGDEARRAENAELLRLLGLGPQPQLDVIRLRGLRARPCASTFMSTGSRRACAASSMRRPSTNCAR